MHQAQKIAFGGGCHWCTEAVFQSLTGVFKVEQGFVASGGAYKTFSEAVVAYFNAEIIPLKVLIEIHLYTHKSTSNHSMRTKYRSAIYTFYDKQEQESKRIVKSFQKRFKNQLITKVLPFKSFRPSRIQIQNYYYNNPEKPFCERFINPKLHLVLEQFSGFANKNKLKHLQNEQYKTKY